MNNKKRIGRNDPCPCGSGKKFKKCHGISAQVKFSPIRDPLSDPEIRNRIEQMKAAQIQREKQQGLGRPIISSLFKGYRIVAVGNRIYWNKEEICQTFIDFLSLYIRRLFGQEWANVELKKDPEDRHPLMQWYGSVCEEQRKAFKKEGEVFNVPVTGAMFAYITLAYNLYLIAHNTHLVHGEGLHARLIDRLKSKESFFPAFYETMVVASFIKAGFQIELENEADSSTHHAEFVATSAKTKRIYSVEAKHRQIGKQNTAIRNQLYKAL
ncbi:MAG: SEC-C domain-containing protein [Planctomycetes bacterium]|nr:SEC-C domain-containing protein [Planctomycetota bacterium]